MLDIDIREPNAASMASSERSIDKLRANGNPAEYTDCRWIPHRRIEIPRPRRAPTPRRLSLSPLRRQCLEDVGVGEGGRGSGRKRSRRSNVRVIFLHRYPARPAGNMNRLVGRWGKESAESEATSSVADRKRAAGKDIGRELLNAVLPDIVEWNCASVELKR